MDFQIYQAQAARTAKVGDDQFNAVHAALGLASETGEFVDTVKKHVIYGKPLDAANLHEELGDLLWYMALAANSLGMSLADIAQANINKLRKRYPEKYTDMDALARADKAEA